VVSSLQSLIKGFGVLLGALGEAVDDEQAIIDALAMLGWLPPPGIDIVSSFTFDTAALLTALEPVVDATATDLADDSLMESRYLTLVSAVAEQVPGIVDLATNLDHALQQAGAQATDYATKTQIVTELPRRLLDFMIVSGVMAVAAPLGNVLFLLGVFSTQSVAEDQANYVSAHVQITVAYDRLGALLSDPGHALATDYSWASAQFDAERLLNGIGALLGAVGARSVLTDMDAAVEQRLDNAPTATDTAPTPQLLVELLNASGPEAAQVLASIHRRRPTVADGSDTGVEIALFARGQATERIPLVDPITLVIGTEIDIEGGIGLVIRPAGVSVRGGLISGDLQDVTGEITVGIEIGAAAGDPITLLVVDGGTSFVFQVAYINVGVASPDLTDFTIGLGMQGAQLAVTTGQADSFLSSLLPASMMAKFDFGLVWSRVHGLQLKGSGSLELDIPLNVDFGPIELDSLTIELSGGSDGSADVSLGVSGGFALGPIAATVQNIGVITEFSQKDGGNLGPVQLDLKFKPPDGAGLEIDAGPVGGGGFMSFDDNQKQYAGILELLIPELSLTVIGLVTTRMPDGSDGFSMLVIVAVELPPIQLGMGFTLNKIGGLLGVNRGMNTDALQAGLKTGTLDSIQFPHDVIANAPKIINDIKTVFPVAVGQYVFGPMIGLGWGTPSLVTLDLGLVLELPHPLRLVILGKLGIALPVPDDAIVLLQIEVLGIFDFDQKTISVDGTLGDSRIVTFPISGDMALRASYGSSPSLAMSAGGFNPQFQSPPTFPAKMDRMAIALADGDNPRLRLEAYFAVTSNTIQAGARLDLYVEKDMGIAGDFSVAGELYFDALVKLQPFQIVIDLGAQLEVQRNGSDFCSVSLTMTISGPRPWHAWGKGTVHILGSDHSIPFDVTIGPSDPPPPLPPADPRPDLLAALKTPGNWSARLPAGAGAMVKLANVDGDAANGGASTKLVLHPAGQATVSQRVVPLDVQISTYGHQPLAGGPTTYSVTSVSDLSGTLGKSPVQDMFAPADFFALTDDQKLSRPGFEPMDSGVAVTNSLLSAAAGVTAQYGYATEVIDQAASSPPVKLSKTFVSGAVAAALARQSSAARVGARNQGDGRFPAPGTPVKLAEPAYTLSSRSTLQAVGVTGTYTQVAAMQAGGGSGDPRGAADLQIVGASEVLS
jgi:hypothetical protein